MFKRGFQILIFILLIIGLIGCSNQNAGTSVSAENKEVDEEYTETNEMSEEERKKAIGEIEKEAMEEFIHLHPDYEKYRAKLEKLTDEEMIELINKSKENKHQITEDFTEEEALILRTLTADEYYNLVGMSEDEVYKLLDGFHDSINTNIIVASQEGGFDSEEYEDHRKVIWSFKTEFEWIRDNFEFEKEYHHELIKEIISLMDDHVLGDNDALFSLKYILYELNAEFNPHTLKEERANNVSLSNAVKIQKERIAN